MKVSRGEKDVPGCTEVKCFMFPNNRPYSAVCTVAKHESTSVL